MYLGQRSWKTFLANAVNYAVLLLYAIICCYPLYYIFIYSISDSALAGAGLTLRRWR